MGAPLGEPGGGLPVGDPEYYRRRAQGTGTSLYGGSVGAAWGGLIYWDFKIWLKGFWGWSVSLSPWDFCEGNLEGGGSLPGILKDI
jgi:hypothetical protein